MLPNDIVAGQTPASPSRHPAIIKKGTRAGELPPNLVEYESARAAFSWTAARRHLDGLPGDRGLNIAHEAIDRHAAGPHGARVALRCISRHGERRDLTYIDMQSETSRFANVLRRLGVGRQGVVATLAGRIPLLYVAALGTMKHGSVYAPLFSAFGPDPIAARLTIARARAIVTTDTLYRRKLEPLRSQLKDLEHVLLVRETAAPLPPGPTICAR